MLLCLGPSGAGKTTLIKKLSSQNESETNTELPAVVQTMGTNIGLINIDEKSVEIHEVGGAMAAIWSSHFRECTAMIYVIDAGNLQQISCSCALLIPLLKEPSLGEVPFLIVLNKVDVFGTTVMATSLEDIKHFLQLDSIIKYAKQNLTVTEISCLTGKGLRTVLNWMKRVV